MTAAQRVLARMLDAGVQLVTDDPAGLRFKGVPRELAPLVQEHGAKIRRLLEEGDTGPSAAEPPAMPSLTRAALEMFGREGDSVGIKLSWLPDTLLWWAPNETEAAKLIVWGIAKRGAVWTAEELTALIGLAGPDARAVVRAKLAVDGGVVETRPRNAA